VGVTAYFTLENLGVQRTTAGDAALLMAAIPVICLAVEAIWFRQAISWRRSMGIGVSILGVFLVIGQAPGLGWDRWVGDSLVVAAAFCWAIYSLLGRRLNQYPKLTVVAHQSLYGSLMLFPLALLEFSQWRGLSMEAGVSVMYLGLMCSAMTYLLYNYALKALAASQVSTFLNLVPIIGVIAAMVLLGEQMQVAQILGGGVILAGVVLSAQA
jgi:drug/metabolite transporter (DMT)-like permease